MKRIIKIIYGLFITLLITTSMSSAQVKKPEQKIKIITSDGTGTKVIIDTLIKGDQINDSLKLKNGKVIFIGHPGKGTCINHKGGPEHYIVSVSSDGKDSEDELQTITVVSSDSAASDNKETDGKIFVYSSSDEHGGKDNVHYRVITRESNGGVHKGDKIIYINKGIVSEKDMDKTFDVYVPADERDDSAEKTRYIIAKDGIVVTVEGNDEAKSKELMDMIEKHLGVKGEETVNKETIKNEQRKRMKK